MVLETRLLQLYLAFTRFYRHRASPGGELELGEVRDIVEEIDDLTD